MQAWHISRHDREPRIHKMIGSEKEDLMYYDSNYVPIRQSGQSSPGSTQNHGIL